MLIGVAFTGLPLVHMARYHMGVFYTSFFALLIIPSAIAMRMGAQLVANAMCESTFAEGLVAQEFTSPAGWFALIFGAIVMGLSLLFILVNLLSLSKVAYRPSLAKGGTLMGLGLVVMLVITMTATPFLAAMEFDHELGQQGAVGFESFDPKDVMLTQGWVKWLSKGEHRSTYGNMVFWLSMVTWFVFFALVVAIVGFIGIALYSANDRKSYTQNLAIAPMGSLVFVIFAFLFYFGYSGNVAKVAERLNVSSDVTEFTYMAGNYWIAFLLILIVLAFGIFYTMAIRDWLQSLFKGTSLVDPISMNSMVDPPTDLPPPPTGWPARMDKMSNANWIVVVLACIVLVSGMAGGVYIKKGVDAGSSINTGQQQTIIDLNELKDEQRTFTLGDYAAEGASRPILWQPDGVWFIKEIEIVVTWTDEQPRFNHVNTPDTFEVEVNSTTGEGATQSGSSMTTTLQGEVRLRIEFENYILTTDPGLELPSGAVEGAINVNITCTEAGDEEPANIGIFVFPDDGNAFDAVMIVHFKLFERN
jgi:hypothetical protein